MLFLNFITSISACAFVLPYKEIGFKEVEICKSGYTKIHNPGKLNLNEQEEHSVYVEGVK